MSVVIGRRTFNDDTTTVDLIFNQLTKLPVEIRNLVNLKKLYLEYNQLTSLPVEIGNLLNLQSFNLTKNRLTSLPVEILTIIKKLGIDDTSYQINNISYDTECLIFRQLYTNLENLPLTLKTLYLRKNIDLTKHTIKLPFSCIIERY